MTKIYSALIALADGTEELEFAACVDILGCAGFQVFVCSVMPEKRLDCVMSRGIKITANYHITDENVSGETFDVIIVPGGIPGAANCAASVELVTMLKKQKARGGWYAAICAAPSVVFLDQGIVQDEKMVCYEFKEYTLFSDPVRKNGNMSESKARVLVDGKCITSVGPGSAMEFGLAIVKEIMGEEKALDIAQGMLIT